MVLLPNDRWHFSREFNVNWDDVVFDPNRSELKIIRPQSQSVLLGHPQPMAWRKTNENPVWQNYCPKISIPKDDIGSFIHRLATPDEKDGQLLLPFFLNNRRDKIRRTTIAWLNWCATIPEQFRALISSFPNCHWRLLCLISNYGKAAIDLTINNPALAYAVASHDIFRQNFGRSPWSVRDMLSPGINQRDILEWLGFCRSEATRKALRKIVHRSIRIPELLIIRHSMKQPGIIKTLSHLKCINAGVIRITIAPKLSFCVKPSLLEEVSNMRNEDENPRVASLLRESLKFFSRLYPKGIKFPVIRRLSKLYELHKSLAEDHIKHHFNAKIQFPPPPVQGIETVVPITSTLELMQEGYIQNNCVADYLALVVAEKKYYAYRVLAPERCTLMLKKDGNTWKPLELKCRRNRPASKETSVAINQWLSKQAGFNIERIPESEFADVSF